MPRTADEVIEQHGRPLDREANLADLLAGWVLEDVHRLIARKIPIEEIHHWLKRDLKQDVTRREVRAYVKDFWRQQGAPVR